MRLARKKAANFWARQAIPAEREADPLATRVLNHGEAIVAPRGRADDFSWPRANPSSTAEDVELPDAVPVKAPTETKPVVIKSDEAKKHPAQSAPTPVRAKTAPSRRPTHRVRHPALPQVAPWRGTRAQR